LVAVKTKLRKLLWPDVVAHVVSVLIYHSGRESARTNLSNLAKGHPDEIANSGPAGNRGSPLWRRKESNPTDQAGIIQQPDVRRSSRGSVIHYVEKH